MTSIATLQQSPLDILRNPDYAATTCAAIQHTFEVSGGFYNRFYLAARFAVQSSISVGPGDEILAEAAELNKFVATMRDIYGNRKLPLSLLTEDELLTTERADPLLLDQQEGIMEFPSFEMTDPWIAMYALRRCSRSMHHTDIERAHMTDIRSAIAANVDTSVRGIFKLVKEGVKKRKLPLLTVAEEEKLYA